MKYLFTGKRIFWLLAGSLCLCSCKNEIDKKPVVSDTGTLIEQSHNNSNVDHSFLATLRTAGIFDAASQIGLDAKVYLSPLAEQISHPYRRYRWSVGYHEAGGIMISALPPEEEVGWTPWERWYKDDAGHTRKESWVMYPLKNPTSSGVARWYKLDDTNLAPRFLHQPGSLEDQLRLARIYEAAKVLEFDVEDVLIKPLLKEGRDYYQQCRWVVVPHILGEDGPVIYILPPMHMSDEWPWESWYTDGKTKLIHHVHYTSQNEMTTSSWRLLRGVFFENCQNRNCWSMRAH